MISAQVSSANLFMSSYKLMLKYAASHRLRMNTKNDGRWTLDYFPARHRKQASHQVTDNFSGLEEEETEEKKRKDATGINS